MAGATRMRRRSVIALIMGFCLVAALTVGLLVYDSAQSGTIAKGVRVGDVPIGGLSRARARDRLRAQLLTPLNRPLTIRANGRAWRLTPQRARVSADLDADVQAALDRSRQGSIFTRTVSGLTGASVDANLPARITYDHGAVVALVRHIAASVDAAPQDAHVAYSAFGVQAMGGTTGRALLADGLRSEIRRSLLDPAAPRTITARTRTLAPRISAPDLASRYPAVVVIDRADFKLRLFKHLKLARTYGIAVGMQGLETPAGLYDVQDKEVDPSWHVPNSSWAGSLAGQTIPPGPQDPLKARWLGIYNGAGIHGTEETGSIGTAGSHGCIRMLIPDVIELYPQVPLHAPVYIA